MSVMTTPSPWFYWALLSAVFAALRAIFAKIGIQGVDSDYATLIRTMFIIVVLSVFVWFASEWTNPVELSSKNWLFLRLSGFSTVCATIWLAFSSTKA
jgi:transporter family protein